jgi:hypothetical protein
VLAEAGEEPLPIDNIPSDAIIQVDTGEKVQGTTHA